jgi:hypothetical protein
MYLKGAVELPSAVPRPKSDGNDIAIAIKKFIYFLSIFSRNNKVCGK